MVVNITKAKEPFLIKDVDLPKGARIDSLQMMGNGLALAETLNEPGARGSEDHQRSGVTALAVSFDFNLLFFANSEGLWILSQQWMQPPSIPAEAQLL